LCILLVHIHSIRFSYVRVFQSADGEDSCPLEYNEVKISRSIPMFMKIF
jgi:hypothetical protein